MLKAKKSTQKPKQASEKTASSAVEMKLPTRTKPSLGDILESTSIHIYGYGETQLIQGKVNVKKDNSTLKSLVSFIEYLATQQQKRTKISYTCNQCILRPFG